MTHHFNSERFRKSRLPLLQTFLIMFCLCSAILSQAEYSLNADATYTYLPPGLVTGKSYWDMASVYEAYTYNSASASASFARPIFGDLSIVSSQAQAELTCTVTWQYLGGGPPGGTFATQENCFARVNYGTSTADRDANGVPINVFVAFAEARSPDIFCNTAGHAGPYTVPTKTDGHSVNVLDTDHDTLYLRASATVGPSPLSVSASANVRWTLTEIH